MKLPHLALLHAYGNEQVLLEKAAGYGALAARLAVGMMESNRSLDARGREEELQEQAERMNHAFRRLEARKMDPVREHMRHTRMPLILMAGRPQGGYGGDYGFGMPLQGVPRSLTGEDVPLGMDEGMVRMASAIGSDLAVYSFSKEAGIGGSLGGLARGLGGLAKGTAKGVGGMLGGATRGAGMGLQRAGQAVAGAPSAMKNFAVGKLQGAGQAGAGVVEGAKNKIQGVLQGAQQKMQQAGTSLQRAGNRVQGRLEGVGTTLENKGLGQVQPQKPFSQMSTGQRQLAADSRLQQMKQKGITPGGKLEPAQPAAQPAAAQPSPPVKQPEVPHPQPAEPQAPKPDGPADAVKGGDESDKFNLQKMWDRTGLSNERWKYKLPLLGAGALGAYGLYAGAKKGFELLGREPQPAQYNAGGAIPAYGVNEYGTPDRSTPFTY